MTSCKIKSPYRSIWQSSVYQTSAAKTCFLKAASTDQPVSKGQNVYSFNEYILVDGNFAIAIAINMKPLKGQLVTYISMFSWANENLLSVIHHIIYPHPKSLIPIFADFFIDNYPEISYINSN